MNKSALIISVAYIGLIYCGFGIPEGQAAKLVITTEFGEKEKEKGEEKQEEPKKEKVGDFIEFVNGDSVSGEIISISKGKLRFIGNAISKVSRAEVVNIKRMEFARKMDSGIGSDKDQILFPNGDRFDIDLKKLNDKQIEGVTATGDTIILDRSKVEGIVFKKISINTFEERFDDPENVKFTSIAGEWAVEEGRYIQKETTSSSKKSYLTIAQSGCYRYRWSLDTSKNSSNGFYFFAENNTTSNGGNSYYVMVSGKAVYLYKCMQDNQQYYASFTIPSKENISDFDLTYNSGTGSIILLIDNQEAISWKDTQPLEKGNYVVLSASGYAVFDNFIFGMTGGGKLPSLASEEGDVVLFANEDVLVGTVIGVSDEGIIIDNEYFDSRMTFLSGSVSSIRFKGEAVVDLPALGGGQKLSMWNGSAITGKILALDDKYITLESKTVGKIVIQRTLLKSIEGPVKFTFQ